MKNKSPPQASFPRYVKWTKEQEETEESSEVEQQVVQLDIRFPVDALTHQKGQFVGVLAGGGHSDGSLYHNNDRQSFLG